MNTELQKYNKGDHVQVAKDLGPMMGHFQSNCEAIVEYTSNEEYGDGDIVSYSIYIKNRGSVAWYEAHQLDLIETNRLDLLEQWKAEAKKKADMKSDLDWIFGHGEEVLEHPSGATISALAKCFGLINLWGLRGEGITYYQNAMMTLEMARPYLLAGDKDGWIEHCKSIRGNYEH